MVSILVSLIIFCSITGALCFAAQRERGVLGWPEPWAWLIYALVVLLLLCLFLSEVGWIGAPHRWRTWH